MRVVLVDDHEMVLEGLKAMLARFAGRVRVVGQAGSAVFNMTMKSGTNQLHVKCV